MARNYEQRIDRLLTECSNSSLANLFDHNFRAVNELTAMVEKVAEIYDTQSVQCPLEIIDYLEDRIKLMGKPHSNPLDLPTPLLQ